LINTKKLAFAAIAGIAISAVPAEAPAQLDSTTTTTLIALLLASQLGVQPSLVSELALTDGYAMNGYYNVPPYTRTVYDLAPVFVIEKYAPRRRPIEILQMRRRGWAWDRVATWAGMPIVTYRRLYAAHQFDPNWWGNTIVTRQLMVPTTDVYRMRNMGLNWRDMTLATIMAREARQPVYTVATRYRTVHNWNTLGTYYHVKPTVFRTRVAEIQRTRRVPTYWRSTVAARPSGAVIHNGVVVRPGARAMTIRPHTRTTVRTRPGTVVRPKHNTTTIVRRPHMTVRTHTIAKPHGSTTIVKRTNHVTTPSGNHHVNRTVIRTHHTMTASGRVRTTRTVQHHVTNTHHSTPANQKKKGHGG
jgi:hypothetical protein